MTPPRLVKEIMTETVTTLQPGSRLLDAALLMRSTGFRHLPVVQDGILVGIISDRDIKRHSPSMLAKISQEEYNKIFEETTIEKVMTKDPQTVSPGSPIKEAIQVMHDRKFGAIPVVDEGKKLVGIVTTTDALGLLATLLG